MAINKYKVLNAVKWAISYIVIIMVLLFALFPLYYIVILSFSKVPSLALLTLRSLIPSPSSMTISTYEYVLHSQFFLWLRNSLILSLGTVALAILIAFLAGIALARLNVPGKKALVVVLYILTFFPFTAIVIPIYLVYAHLDLLNNYFGLILIYSSGTSIFGAYMSKIFIDSIPRDYEEAAMIDGLSRFRALFTVLFRIARPVIIFLALLSFIGAYTDYAVINVLVTKGSLYTLMLGLYYVSTIASGNAVSSVALNVFAAFSLLMGLPIVALYVVFQKYLTQIYAASGLR